MRQRKNKVAVKCNPFGTKKLGIYFNMYSQTILWKLLIQQFFIEIRTKLKLFSHLEQWKKLKLVYGIYRPRIFSWNDSHGGHLIKLGDKNKQFITSLKIY